MTSVLDAPVDRAPDRSTRDRRRTRALVLVLAVASVLLLALSVLRAVPGTVRFDPVVPVVGGSAQSLTLPTYGPQGMHVVGYDHGATAVLTLTVRNTGLLPVTVTSAALDGGVAPLLDVREVSGLPLSIGPGDTGRFDVTAVLGNCKYFHEREAQFYDEVALGFSVLGQDGTRTVATDRPIMVKSPMIVGCPDRLLNRQGNDRSDLTDAA